MLKKTIKYTDFNGEEVTEDFYFNITKAEALETSFVGSKSLDVIMRELIATKDVSKILDIVKELLLKAYGVKSSDGRRFIKNDDLREEFAQTQAFSDIYIEFMTDTNAFIKFINGALGVSIDEKTVTEAQEQAVKLLNG